MSFDVIIVNYNCYEALSSCLSRLEKWEPAKLDTIYVIDNSQVPLPDDLVRRFPRVIWLANNENIFVMYKLRIRNSYSYFEALAQKGLFSV